MNESRNDILAMHLLLFGGGVALLITCGLSLLGALNTNPDLSGVDSANFISKLYSVGICFCGVFFQFAIAIYACAQSAIKKLKKRILDLESAAQA